MRIALASDHAGFDYKQRLQLILIESGHHVRDFGPDAEEPPVDYPLFIRPAAEAVARGEYDRGIIFGGSGNGEAIVANRVPGIRCVLCWNVESARLGREHNDANMLSIGQRMVDFEEMLAMVETWLETPFAGGRHLRRIRLIDKPYISSHGEKHAISSREERNDISSHVENGDAQIPHRTSLVDEGTYICDSCRQEFRFPVDISEGTVQQIVERCPVCSHDNTMMLQVETTGRLTIRGDLHTNG